MNRRMLLAALMAPSVLPGLARAQSFPDHPIRLVSPYPPGGGTDTSARLLAPPMTEFLGQPIVVENRGGAGGALGAAVVADAPPDGYTLLLDSLGHVVNPHILKGLRFDYATAFAPVSLLVVLPQFMVVPASLPVNTLAEFLAWAKARPGQLSYGSSGNGTGAHLAAVLFVREAGLDITHVPYRGGSAVIPDLIAGNVAFAFATVSTSAQLIREGRLKALAVTYKERLPSMPEVPTMAELGMPAVNVDEWNALYSVAGTPAGVLARLHAATAHALAQPNVQQRFAQLGGIVIGSPPDETARFVTAQREAMGRLVQEAHISVE
jgi:tripartite-type tricarboxylate transporter receptor subunit TctC